MTNEETLTTHSLSVHTKHNTRWLTICGLLMAINVGLSSFGLPVPGGHLYLNDIVIVAAALMLDPLGAFLVGGVGAFLGDFFFYPLPMFVSLVTHGLQAMAISYIAHHAFPKKPKLSTVIAVLVGAVIMVVGYSSAVPTSTVRLPMHGSSCRMKSCRPSSASSSAPSSYGNGN